MFYLCDFEGLKVHALKILKTLVKIFKIFMHEMFSLDVLSLVLRFGWVRNSRPSVSALCLALIYHDLKRFQLTHVFLAQRNVFIVKWRPSGSKQVSYARPSRGFGPHLNDPVDVETFGCFCFSETLILAWRDVFRCLVYCFIERKLNRTHAVFRGAKKNRECILFLVILPLAP